MPRTPRFAVLLVLLMLSGALAVDSTRLKAQPPTDAERPLPFGALKWRNVGPARGGRSIAAAGSAARPNEYYFGATGGGLWKTTNGGATWSAVTDGQLTSSSVGAGAGAPSNPGVAYIGTGEGGQGGDHAP